MNCKKFLRRELQEVEIERQLRYVLKNVSPEALRPEKLDYKSMREEFKALLGAPPNKKDEGVKIDVKTRAERGIDDFDKH